MLKCFKSILKISNSKRYHSRFQTWKRYHSFSTYAKHFEKQTFLTTSQRRKRPYWKLFWSAFLLRISPYSVQMWENPGKMRTRQLRIRTLFTQCLIRTFTQKETNLTVDHNFAIKLSNKWGYLKTSLLESALFELLSLLFSSRGGRTWTLSY